MTALTAKTKMTVKTDTDNVNHPTHYNSGRIEVIEAIEDWGLNYHRGNAVKYIARAGKKDPSPEKEIEDLRKSAWYIQRAIENIQAQREGRESLKPNSMPSVADPSFRKLEGEWVQVEIDGKAVAAFVPEKIESEILPDIYTRGT